jgi:hypothetical protein
MLRKMLRSRLHGTDFSSVTRIMANKGFYCIIKARAVNLKCLLMKINCAAYIHYYHQLAWYKAIQAECPLSEMLGVGSFSDFGILAYYNEIAWGWEPNRNAKSIYVSYTAYGYVGICRPSWHFQQYLCTTEQRVREKYAVIKVEFSMCGLIFASKKFRISEFQVRDIQPV